MEKLLVEKFKLESIQNALRVTANIHNSRSTSKDRTSHDRMVCLAEQYVDEILKENTILNVGQEDDYVFLTKDDLHNYAKDFPFKSISSENFNREAYQKMKKRNICIYVDGYESKVIKNRWASLWGTVVIKSDKLNYQQIDKPNIKITEQGIIITFANHWDYFLKDVKKWIFESPSKIYLNEELGVYVERTDVELFLQYHENLVK